MGPRPLKGDGTKSKDGKGTPNPGTGLQSWSHLPPWTKTLRMPVTGAGFDEVLQFKPKDHQFSFHSTAFVVGQSQMRSDCPGTKKPLPKPNFRIFRSLFRKLNKLMKFMFPPKPLYTPTKTTNFRAHLLPPSLPHPRHHDCSTPKKVHMQNRSNQNIATSSPSSFLSVSFCLIQRRRLKFSFFFRRSIIGLKLISLWFFLLFSLRFKFWVTNGTR